MVWLHAACEVGGTRSQRDRSAALHLGQQLPPLPTVASTFPDELRLLPWSTRDADVDSGDRRSAGPRDSPDREPSRVDLNVGRRRRDDRSNALEANWLLHSCTVAMRFEVVP